MEANCSVHGMLNISRGIISKSIISITLFPCNSLITKKKKKVRGQNSFEQIKLLQVKALSFLSLYASKNYF